MNSLYFFSFLCRLGYTMLNAKKYNNYYYNNNIIFIATILLFTLISVTISNKKCYKFIILSVYNH